ncbi:hypothetical protein FC70_GL000508 [Paucilactobacillus oligofermentans DSM 15707 = LMG 22743]|uniref:Uncharacterized protein n=1 Tax=Paucilactobacillus oligofermentans DSM 15707 = LMG 22743 TaxID=1423778 RepID=A0A0R1RRG5_9LACO|nr:hypothetical protein [Paucilactobacillus oligofermentans]KRL55923.1 hypothetical protein FC70_GL000508 [Paucilactobacillus oligofermentans DSM 15707 = LMG 22743]CUS26096.1 Uncharacterized protein LACOL_0788 [Paucilactobacillus oligofermentans DSM 15707 = LMG 22743]
MGPFIIIISILLFSMLWQTFFGSPTKKQSSGKHFNSQEDQVISDDQHGKAA